MNHSFAVTSFDPHGEYVRTSRFHDKNDAVNKAHEIVNENPGYAAVVTLVIPEGSQQVFRTKSEPKPAVPVTRDTVLAAFRQLPVPDQQGIVLDLIRDRIAGGGGLAALLGL